jgi:hypothetical protein
LLAGNLLGRWKRMQAFDHLSLIKELFGRDFLKKLTKKVSPKKSKSYTYKVNYVQGSFMMVNTVDFNLVGV